MLLAWMPSAALAQECVISGPSAMCGAPVELCGPASASNFMWTGPDGSGYEDRCIIAALPGTYTLRCMDNLTGAWLTCQHVLAAGSQVVASITGPSEICAGAAAELCGPSGNFEYEWSGPGGATATTACVSAGVAGTWSLRVREGGCWSDVVTHELSVLPRPSISISGPAETCAGTPVELCGPNYMLEYAWSGPGGLTATTACVSAAASGTWSLRARDASDCWSEPATHVLAVTTCGGGGEMVNCPAPAWWWARAFGRSDHPESRLPGTTLSSLGSCVDAAAGSVSWSDPATGLGAMLAPANADLRARAKKQFAAVAANVCAGGNGSVHRGANVVALDPDQSVGLDDFSGTVSSWLAWAEHEIVRLESANLRHKETKRDLRRVVRSGWSINHGHGIGPVCNSSDSDGHDGNRAAQLEDGAEPLEAELDGDETVVELAVEPNPFVTSAGVSFAVPDGGRGEVSVGVYDVSGRLVSSLARGTYAPGYYKVVWNGRDASGSSVRGGLYFVQARVDGAKAIYRLTLVR